MDAVARREIGVQVLTVLVPVANVIALPSFHHAPWIYTSPAIPIGIWLARYVPLWAAALLAVFGTFHAFVVGGIGAWLWTSGDAPQVEQAWAIGFASLVLGAFVSFAITGWRERRP